MVGVITSGFFTILFDMSHFSDLRIFCFLHLQWIGREQALASVQRRASEAEASTCGRLSPFYAAFLNLGPPRKTKQCRAPDYLLSCPLNFPLQKGKWGEMGKPGGNGGKLVEADGKNIQLSTKVVEILQTQAPILALGSVLHRVVLSSGWDGATLPRLPAGCVTAVAHHRARILPGATL